MGDIQTDIAQVSALSGAHAALLHAKPIQKIAPVVQVNKENAAPNSAQRTASKLTSKGLSARVPETRSGLSVGHTTAQSASAKKQFHGLSANQSLEESLGRPHGATATRTRETASSAQKASRMDVSGSKEVSSQSDSSTSTKTEELVASQSKEVFNYLATKEPFKDDLTKWCEYFKQYCERYAFGFDVLRVVLDRIQTEKPDCAAMNGYVDLWSLWASRLALEDQYDVFKMLKNACAKNRKVAALYISMASIKLKSGENSEALRELEKGIGYGAEPRQDLETMADSIRKSLGMGPSARTTSTAGIPQRSALSGSNAALMTPGTPQHLVHMDCDGTPSAHLSSSIQPKAALSATKSRSLSTPSSIGVRPSEAATRPDTVSTPSPIAQSESIGSMSSLGTSTTSSTSATAKRRATTTLGARLGVRGGAQRIPKATAAAPPTVTNGMDVSRDELAERSLGLASIDEGSALMQVDEPALKSEQISPVGSAHVHFAPSPILMSHVGMSAAATSLSSLYNTSTSSQSLGEYAVSNGRSTEPLTGSSSCTQGYSSSLSSQSSHTTSNSTSQSGLSATGLLPTANQEHSATAMRQLAQAIPSRLSAVAPVQQANLVPTRGMTAAPTSTVQNTSAMDVSEPLLHTVSPTASLLPAAPQSTYTPGHYSVLSAPTSSNNHHAASTTQNSQHHHNTPLASVPVASTGAVPPRTASSERLAAPQANIPETYATPSVSSVSVSNMLPPSQPASQLPWLTQQTPASYQAPISAQMTMRHVPTGLSLQQAYPSGQYPKPSQHILPTYGMQAAPTTHMQMPASVVSNPMHHQQQPMTDLSVAIESATLAAKALGRELFMVRGRPYVNLCAIGKGGTCSVYKVMDTTGGIWALKVITWTNDTIEVVKGYNEEVRLLELVQKSPYVVKLMDYEMVATSNTMYILFEFAETDLKRLFVPMKLDAAAAQIRPGGRFATDLDALRYYWRSMLSAVLVLHKSRIVHLDLKPANFVLVEGRVKIIDFGIAKKVLNDTMHAKVDDIAGTILYMAPETLKNTSGRGHPHKVGFPADVWSMGCILHQMVFGFTPFEHVSGLGPKIAAITASDPIEIQPIDNEELMDCLRICLDKTSTNRPTIEQLLNHPFLGGFIRWAQ